MLSSELHVLEKFSWELLQRNKTADNSDQPDQLIEQESFIRKIAADIKTKWIGKLISTAREPVIARYVQFHQAAITHLSDKIEIELTATRSGNKLPGAREKLLVVLLSELEQLIDLLRESFYKYFDADYSLSRHSREKTADEIQQQLAELGESLRNAGIDDALVTAIETGINDRCKDARRLGISYRRLNYLRTLLRYIQYLADSQPALRTSELMIELYRLNFNSYHFIKWYKDSFRAIISAAEKSKRKSLIRGEIEVLERVFVRRDEIFEQSLAPVDEQLLIWLRTEITGQADLYGQAGTKGIERMPLNFSVAQLALFARLCYLEGCFHVNHISVILRFFGQHFETKKQPNISLKSFGRAFYSADQTTAATVRDFLQRMIRHIDKTFFP